MAIANFIYFRILLRNSSPPVWPFLSTAHYSKHILPALPAVIPLAHTLTYEILLLFSTKSLITITKPSDSLNLEADEAEGGLLIAS